MGTRSLASGSVKLTVKATIQHEMTDGQKATCAHDVTPINTSYDDGVDADQANRVWEERDRELANGASDTIDFYNLVNQNIGAGDGNDSLGQALTFEELVLVSITNSEDSTGSLEIEPGASNGMTALGSHTVANGGALPPGANFTKHFPGANALNVTSALKNVKFTANGGALEYNIYLLGRHDDEESSTSSLSSLSTSSSSTSSSLSSTSSQSSLSSSSSTSSVSSSSTSSVSSSSSSSTSSASSSSSSASSSSSSSS